MLVKSLVSVAGHSGQSIQAGDHVDYPEKIAKARIKAGVAAEPDPGAALGDNIAGLKKLLGETYSKLGNAEQLLADERATHAATQDKFDLAAAEFAKERDALKANAAALTKDRDDLKADLADVTKERDALAKERDALKGAAEAAKAK
jgi:septal ring factor EnvC (AmiA/AmiB activator)